MKELELDQCKYLTHIDDLSGLTNLESLRFSNCKNLTSIHDSVGLLNKLKILDGSGCSKITCFPPLMLTSLQYLELWAYMNLKSFPEIIGEMKNVKRVYVSHTCIEEFPASFQNLTGLTSMHVEGGGMLRLTSSVLKMSSKCSKIYFEKCIWPSDTDELNSMVSSSEIYVLRLPCCNVSDEFLPKILTVFANVTILDLSGNNITILPECLKECRFLSELDLSHCKFLQEIKGIPPNLKELNARGCKPFTSSSIRMLLDQKLHEDGGSNFVFPGTDRIPEWFEHRSLGPSITFWFRNSIPSIALFFHSISMCEGDDKIRLFKPRLSINGNAMYFNFGIDYYYDMRSDHTYIYDLRLQERKPVKHLNEPLLENEWFCADISFVDMNSFRDKDLDSFTNMDSDVEVEEEEGEDEDDNKEEEEEQVVKPKLPFLESGIHVFKQNSNMEDIQFTNPYKDE